MTCILLIGKSGQVGQELQTTLAPVAKVVGVGRDELDLTDLDRLRQIIRETKPDVIVNAAAYTAVDKAETESDIANRVNGDAPTAMAEEAQRLGAPFIHISTDYVFDGCSYTPYPETATPNPVGAYGKSKLLGEQGILQVQAQSPDFRFAILRTAWVYGTYGKGNFVKTMLRLGAEREEVRVVADQVGTPTWAADIARAVTTLTLQLVDSTGTLAATGSDALSGIYNFTNSGVTSWYDFAVAIFEEAEALGFPVQLKRVVPITTSEYPTLTQRPAYSVLACQKITALLQAPPVQWRQALRQMLTELYAQTHESNYSLRR